MLEVGRLERVQARSSKGPISGGAVTVQAPLDSAVSPHPTSLPAEQYFNTTLLKRCKGVG